MVEVKASCSIWISPAAGIPRPLQYHTSLFFLLLLLFFFHLFFIFKSFRLFYFGFPFYPFFSLRAVWMSDDEEMEGLLLLFLFSGSLFFEGWENCFFFFCGEGGGKEDIKKGLVFYYCYLQSESVTRLLD